VERGRAVRRGQRRGRGRVGVLGGLVMVRPRRLLVSAVSAIFLLALPPAALAVLPRRRLRGRGVVRPDAGRGRAGRTGGRPLRRRPGPLGSFGRHPGGDGVRAVGTGRPPDQIRRIKERPGTDGES
jgi:hypothetical protein